MKETKQSQTRALVSAYLTNWTAAELQLKTVYCFQPPVIPRMDGDGDTSNFDDYPDDSWKDAVVTSNGHPFYDF